MGKHFDQGYALVVGVGGDLPFTVNDAIGLAGILQDPERCAYPLKDHVLLLTGEGATRGKIRSSFKKLASLTNEDSTVVVYFSGHGYRATSKGKESYYLMPYGYDTEKLGKTAVSGGEFADHLRAIKAQKLLLLLDCCHAGGVGLTKTPGGEVVKAPGGVEMVKAPMPSEALALLREGEGRALIASSRADEESLAGKPYSVFTAALIEGLCGAGAAVKDGLVRVSDLALYTHQASAERSGGQQHPVLNYEKADNFAVAFYAGGDVEPKSPPLDVVTTVPEPKPGAFNRSPQITWEVTIIRGDQINAGRDAYTINKGNMYFGDRDRDTKDDSQEAPSPGGTNKKRKED